MTKPRPYRDTATITHPEGDYRVGVSDVGWVYVSRTLPTGRHVRVAFPAETGLKIIDEIADAIEQQ
ncbi:hypothetical protein A5718_07895 [Mycolicibacterium conceptionense]|uniref:hypothetical protein n=1 Tax=Mycolicibacterium conceptionense TaxID=451644 RepID=UPI0007EA6BB2|nr:hypothetical protein [Mycolicibacterium conceptionense]OBB10724.1 hypothetical protein A5718_07895 [Mycolicibacterium conceptionense]